MANAIRDVLSELMAVIERTCVCVDGRSQIVLDDRRARAGAGYASVVGSVCGSRSERVSDRLRNATERSNVAQPPGSGAAPGLDPGRPVAVAGGIVAGWSCLDIRAALNGRPDGTPWAPPRVATGYGRKRPVSLSKVVSPSDQP